MLFLIDFGLAKMFRSINGNHIELIISPGLIGFANTCFINI